MKAVGCYIFAGGFTQGMSKHFKILAHLEQWKFGTDTFKLNFPKIPVYFPPETWPIDDLRKKGVQLVYGNPPCAAWSAAGKSMTRGGNNWRTDECVDCTRNLFELIDKIRPNIWIWESVTRAYTLGRELIDDFTQRAFDMGYSVTYFLTNNALHGLPQQRKRFHMVVHNVKINFDQPTGPITTVKEALKGFKNPGRWKPKMAEGHREVLPGTPEGAAVRPVWDMAHKNPEKYKRKGRVYTRGAPPMLMHKVDSNKPCSTITSMLMQVHWNKNRFFTPWEVAHLCGYPLDWQWSVPPAKIYQEAAQAVTPVTGDYLGKMFAKALKKNRRTKGVLNIVDYRNTIIDGYGH